MPRNRSKAELTCRHYRIKNAKDEVFIGEECVIPKLKIDDMVFEGLIGCISENTVATESEKWLDTNDLVLGRDLYDNRLILIDYEGQKLVFGDSLTELEEMGYDFKKWNCTKMEYNNFGIHLVVIPNPGNKFIFEQRESCRNSSKSSSIVLSQYNGT